MRRRDEVVCVVVCFNSMLELKFGVWLCISHYSLFHGRLKMGRLWSVSCEVRRYIQMLVFYILDTVY